MFHGNHEELYGSRDLASHIELVDVRLTAIGPTAKMRLWRSEEPGEGRRPIKTSIRTVYFDGVDEPLPCDIYQGAKLRFGDVIVGPAIIEEPTTTLVVGFGEEAVVDRYGNYRLLRIDGDKE
jgi:N-methylhydantoinase A